MTLTSLKKRCYDNISLKLLFCKAFTLLKIQFLALFTLFSPYFRSTTNIPYNKKTQKPLYFPRFKALPFFSIRTDNSLILYILIFLAQLKISFSVPLFFSFLDNYLIKKAPQKRPLSLAIFNLGFLALKYLSRSDVQDTQVSVLIYLLIFVVFL